jgi:hypothetical protein
MNIITESNDNQNTDERPEPFATILDLLSEHSEGEILAAISDAAEFEAEDEETCSTCRVRSARLHLELDQLLDRMSDFEDAVMGMGGEADQDPEGSPTTGDGN